MVETAEEDRGWQAANDGGNRWLVNVDQKGKQRAKLQNGQRTKTSRQSCERPNHIVPRFERLKVTAGEIPENGDKPLKESGEEPNRN
jgi:hypothetical protein